MRCHAVAAGAIERVDRPVDHETMPLVVVRSTPVPHDVRRVDGRAEERLADVVHRLRERVGQSNARPGRRPLDERDVQPVIVGIGERRILVVVPVGGSPAGSRCSCQLPRRWRRSGSRTSAGSRRGCTDSRRSRCGSRRAIAPLRCSPASSRHSAGVRPSSRSPPALSSAGAPEGCWGTSGRHPVPE